MRLDRRSCAAVAGLTKEELTARPGPGKWSILEVVVHLADSDAISIDRMKRMLSEDNPALVRQRNGLRGSPAHARAGSRRRTHTDGGRPASIGAGVASLPMRRSPAPGSTINRGRKRSAGMVASYVDHIDDHMKFIVGNRANLGKPLR